MSNRQSESLISVWLSPRSRCVSVRGPVASSKLLDDVDLVREVAGRCCSVRVIPSAHLIIPSASGDSSFTPESCVIVPVLLAQPAVYNLHLSPLPFLCTLSAVLYVAAALIKHQWAAVRLRGVAGHKSLGPADDNVLSIARGPYQACFMTRHVQKHTSAHTHIRRYRCCSMQS